MFGTHRFPRLQAGGLEHDAEGAIAHHPVRAIVEGLAVGAAAAGGLQYVPPPLEVAIH